MYLSAADSHTAALVLLPAGLGVAIGLSCWQAILLRRTNAHPSRYLPLVLSIAAFGVMARIMLEGAFDWRVWSSLVVGAVAVLAIILRTTRNYRSAIARAASATGSRSYTPGMSSFATTFVYLLLLMPMLRERKSELAHGIVVTHRMVTASVADSLERVHPTAVPKDARFVRVRRQALRTSFVPGDLNGPHTVCHAQPLHINVDLLKWPDSPSDSAFEARAIKTTRAFLASHRRSALAGPTMTIEQCAAELRAAFTKQLGIPQRVATSAWLSAPDSSLNTPAASPRSPR